MPMPVCLHAAVSPPQWPESTPSVPVWSPIVAMNSTQGTDANRSYGHRRTRVRSSRDLLTLSGMHVLHPHAIVSQVSLHLSSDCGFFSSKPDGLTSSCSENSTRDCTTPYARLWRFRTVPQFGLWHDARAENKSSSPHILPFQPAYVPSLHVPSNPEGCTRHGSCTVCIRAGIHKAWMGREVCLEASPRPHFASPHFFKMHMRRHANQDGKSILDPIRSNAGTTGTPYPQPVHHQTLTQAPSTSKLLTTTSPPNPSVA